MSPNLLRLVIYTSLGGSLSVPLLWSQGHQSCQCATQSPESIWADAANRWQLTAIDAKSQVDMVSPVLRAQRNAYWKAPLEAQRGLSAAQGSYVEDAPEFPSEPDDAWVMATFEAFHVFAIDPDYQLTYTELNFRIEKVFKQAASLSLSSESLIDADMPGGRIKSPNGDILSFRIAPFPYFFLLGHKYLVHLSYQAQGGFFFAGKRWDISSGRVQPDDPGEIGRAAHGKSSIAGKSVTDLVNYLPSVLPDGVADH